MPSCALAGISACCWDFGRKEGVTSRAPRSREKPLQSQVGNGHFRPLSVGTSKAFSPLCARGNPIAIPGGGSGLSALVSGKQPTRVLRYALGRHYCSSSMWTLPLQFLHLCAFRTPICPWAGAIAFPEMCTLSLQLLCVFCTPVSGSNAGGPVTSFCGLRNQWDNTCGVPWLLPRLEGFFLAYGPVGVASYRLLWASFVCAVTAVTCSYMLIRAVTGWKDEAFQRCVNKILRRPLVEFWSLLWLEAVEVWIKSVVGCYVRLQTAAKCCGS